MYNEDEMKEAGYREVWVTYGSGHYSAKELTVLPRRSVTIKDKAAYGAILTQGHGSIARRSISTPSIPTTATPTGTTRLR